MKNNRGYTLIETLVALSMLFIIATPILSVIFRNNHAIEAERVITGIGILEQEARRISADPQAMVHEKKITINGREWIITTEKTGSGIVLYHMVVSLEKKRAGEICFLQREK